MPVLLLNIDLCIVSCYHTSNYLIRSPNKIFWQPVAQAAEGAVKSPMAFISVLPKNVSFPPHHRWKINSWGRAIQMLCT